MYSVLSTVLFSFLLRGKNAERPPLPSFKGIIELRHLLPGRIRFFVPSILTTAYDLDAIKAQFLTIKGVQAVEISAISGTILIHFHQDILEPMVIFAIVVKLFGLEEALNRVPQSILTKEIKNIHEAVNRSLYENTAGFIDLRTGVPIVLAALGIYKLVSQKGAPILPGGITLLWWAYNSLCTGGTKQDV